jgi:cell division protein FtsL
LPLLGVLNHPNFIVLETEMTDWADGIDIHNNGIKCVIDSRVLSELLRIIICLGLIAGSLFFYSWVRSQIVYTGYETQKLFTVEEKLRNIQDNLIVEEEYLTNPKRIDEIAIRELGMKKLHPSQMILPPIQTLDQGITGSLAMAGSETGNLENSEKREGFGGLFIN